MLEQNVKLEQEIVSLDLMKRGAEVVLETETVFGGA